MKRTYVLTREKIVYYRKEVELDTNNWDQIYELFECMDIDPDQWTSWTQVPELVQQQVIEYFESTLEDEDLTDDECYDTEEWCEDQDFVMEEELEAAE
jgi:hypothetical protein